MKLITFLRTPKYQKFHLEPRYYDPVKEELKEKEARILNRIKADANNLEEYDNAYQSSIEGSFVRRRSSSNSSTSFTQLVIMFLLAGLIFGFLYFGEIALYIVVTISSLLLYLKMKRKL